MSAHPPEKSPPLEPLRAAKPGSVSLRRSLPRLVLRWDLDKTYLDTDFDSFRALVRAPFEKAEDKVDLPGVATLIRALRRSAVERGQEVEVFFLTASPPQLRKAIRQKLLLDGVEVDSIVFKDQLYQIVRGRFRYLREQVGFKVAELLKARLTAAGDTVEVLFGDDWESDAIAYSLYADFVAGRIGTVELLAVLRRLDVDPSRVREIERLAPSVVLRETVLRIFIHLRRRTPPSSFLPFGTRLVPTFDYFQTAAVLTQDGFCDCDGLRAVAQDLKERAGYGRESLAESLADLRSRGILSRGWYKLQLAELAAAGVLDPGRKFFLMRMAWWRRLCRNLWLRRSPARRGAGVTRSARSQVKPQYLPLAEQWVRGGSQQGFCTGSPGSGGR